VAHGLRNETEKAISDFEHYIEYGQDEFWLESARRQLDELRGEPPESSPADGG
jgi:hypothetical protein